MMSEAPLLRCVQHVKIEGYSSFGCCQSTIQMRLDPDIFP
jgi:hypothetical protein